MGLARSLCGFLFLSWMGAVTGPLCFSADPATTFSLTILPTQEKLEYLPLLPVVITIELKNECNTPQPIGYRGLGLEEAYPGNRMPQTLPSLYNFVIEQSDGAQRPAYLTDWVNWSYDRARGSWMPFLGPEQKQILDYCLGFGVNRFPDTGVQSRDVFNQAAAVFPTVGEYRVHLKLPRLGLISNTLWVMIKEPITTSDILALDILSHSKKPAVFLTSPMRWDGGGIGILDHSDISDSTSSGSLETCRKILTRYPDSAYAPYARLVWATALVEGWVEYQMIRKPSMAVSVDRRVEGLQLLRQCAEDSKLPRRYREEALLSLRRAAEQLDKHLRRDAEQKVPSLEAVLGVPKVSVVGFSAIDIFQFAREAVHETGPEGSGKVLRVRFSSEQIKALTTAATSNPDILQALGDTPLQRELQSNVGWAQSELCKIPWRDPKTGRSLIPVGAGYVY